MKNGSHLSLEPNPALVEQARQRAESRQNRVADAITAFAGSMWFVYIHIIWFGCWISFGVEKYRRHRRQVKGWEMCPRRRPGSGAIAHDRVQARTVRRSWVPATIWDTP